MIKVDGEPLQRQLVRTVRMRTVRHRVHTPVIVKEDSKVVHGAVTRWNRNEELKGRSDEVQSGSVDSS
jgi:hypothetical protein